MGVWGVRRGNGCVGRQAWEWVGRGVGLRVRELVFGTPIPASARPGGFDFSPISSPRFF